MRLSVFILVLATVWVEAFPHWPYDLIAKIASAEPRTGEYHLLPALMPRSHNHTDPTPEDPPKDPAPVEEPDPVQESLCNQTEYWEITYKRFEEAGVISNTEKWWGPYTNKARGFDNALGAEFGDHVGAFDCGIGKFGTCITPSCAAFLQDPDKVWAYFARAAVVNMNFGLNAIHNGVTNGQLGFVGLIPDIVGTFMPPEMQNFDPKMMGIWMTAGVGVLFARFVQTPPILALLALITGGIATLSYQLEIMKIEKELTTMNNLGQYATLYGETTREFIENWATDLFNGAQDRAGNDIIDYLPAYAEPVSYDFHDAEIYIKASLIARLINTIWRSTPSAYVMCADVTSSTDDTIRGLDQSWFKDGAGTHCKFYAIDGSAFPFQIFGWDKIAPQPNKYSIKPSDVTESSFRAYKAAGFDYSDQVAIERIKESFNLAPEEQPMAKGAAWEGVFTMPVCHAGSREDWLQTSGTTLMYPCCCGPNCGETRKFVESAKLLGNFAYLEKCKAQLPVMFNQIDYGLRSQGASWRFSSADHIHLGVGVAIGMIGVML